NKKITHDDVKSHTRTTQRWLAERIDVKGMFTIQSDILRMLVEELRASSPEFGAVIDQVLQSQPIEQRRIHLRNLGAIWYRQGGDAEVLTELGLVLAHQSNIEPGVAISELLMSYGAAREEQRTREWERNLRRRMAELDGLHRVISAANSTLELDTSMQMVVETVAGVIGVEACSVYLFERNTQDLVLRATFGLNKSLVGQIRVPMGVGITGWAAEQGQPIPVPDVHQEPRFIQEPMLGEEPFLSMLAVPVVLFSAERFNIGSPDKLQGVISIQTRGPRDFTAEEINFVETVAGDLALFIANAQLYQQTDEQLHQRVRELTTLQQVSKRIAEQLNLDEVLRLIVAKAVDLGHVDRADIFRYDEESRLSLAASYGGESSNGVVQFVSDWISENHQLAVQDAYNDSRFPQLAQIASHEGFFSLFCMPLNARGRTIGAICLYTREIRYFDSENVRLLTIFADEAAIAIENARLYDESQRALAVKSAMLQEMHHRVRNNLQTISALLTMQLRRLPTDEVGSTALRGSIARIQAIAGVHNLLYREDIGMTTVDAVARQIVESAQVSLVNPERPISFAITGESANVGSRDATVLAIVLNELVSNALTHGLAIEGGQVIIETSQDDEMITVEVRDDGPSHEVQKPSSKGSGLGLQIIRTLVTDDLEGSFELANADGWMYARVQFPRRLQTETL
ncbi:MAG: GAF domain-containing protein, partial [Chloroflexota bacterium]